MPIVSELCGHFPEFLTGYAAPHRIPTCRTSVHLQKPSSGKMRIHKHVTVNFTLQLLVMEMVLHVELLGAFIMQPHLTIF